MKLDTHNPSPRNCYVLYQFSSIAIRNLLSLMCELAVFVEALLYVILKAYATFISVTVLLATHPFSRPSKIKFTLNLIDVQVAL